MYYVYLIQGVKKDFLCIGCTNDLRRRFKEHNQKEEKSTKSYAPFRLIYYEAYRDERDAKNREKKLKHHGSVIGHLKRRVRYSVER